MNKLTFEQIISDMVEHITFNSQEEVDLFVSHLTTKLTNARLVFGSCVEDGEVNTWVDYN